MVYEHFNNHFHGYVVETAFRFSKLLASLHLSK
ncbi:hypothetical protein DRN52_05285 [Thermococci archaeon]|nr:MAG: hypothetical protein DRN52_05285 [Thermococci archaeon]